MFIYQADTWCDDCGKAIAARLSLWDEANLTAEDLDYDSDDYPKHGSDDEETDCPQHCAAGAECINAEVLADGTKVGALIGSSLTSDGVEYVREAIREAKAAGKKTGVALELWATAFADYEVDTTDYCPTCGEELDKDCQGDLRCPNCDGPCPYCDDGGGPTASE